MKRRCKEYEGEERGGKGTSDDEDGVHYLNPFVLKTGSEKNHPSGFTSRLVPSSLTYCLTF